MPSILTTFRKIITSGEISATLSTAVLYIHYKENQLRQAHNKMCRDVEEIEKIHRRLDGEFLTIRETLKCIAARNSVVEGILVQKSWVKEVDFQRAYQIVTENKEEESQEAETQNAGQIMTGEEEHRSTTNKNVKGLSIDNPEGEVDGERHTDSVESMGVENSEIVLGSRES